MARPRQHHPGAVRLLWLRDISGWKDGAHLVAQRWGSHKVQKVSGSNILRVNHGAGESRATAVGSGVVWLSRFGNKAPLSWPQLTGAPRASADMATLANTQLYGNTLIHMRAQQEYKNTVQVQWGTTMQDVYTAQWRCDEPASKDKQIETTKCCTAAMRLLVRNHKSREEAHLKSALTMA